MHEDNNLVREKRCCFECLHQRINGRHLLVADECVGTILGVRQEAAQNRLLRTPHIVALLAGEQEDVRQLAFSERCHELCVVHRR